jgi:hypothetical protein
MEEVRVGRDAIDAHGPAQRIFVGGGNNFRGLGAQPLGQVRLCVDCAIGGHIAETNVGAAHVFPFPLCAAVLIRMIVQRMRNTDEDELDLRRLFEPVGGLLQTGCGGILDAGRALDVLVEGDGANLLYARGKRSALRMGWQSAGEDGGQSSQGQR